MGCLNRASAIGPRNCKDAESSRVSRAGRQRPIQGARHLSKAGRCGAIDRAEHNRRHISPSPLKNRRSGAEHQAMGPITGTSQMAKLFGRNGDAVGENRHGFRATRARR